MMIKRMFDIAPVDYVSPEVEIMEILVEKGFASSPGNEGVGEEDGNGNFS